MCNENQWPFHKVHKAFLISHANATQQFIQMSKNHLQTTIFQHYQVKVMKYHVEAKDNAKFLGSIEKASHCIYLQVST